MPPASHPSALWEQETCGLAEVGSPSVGPEDIHTPASSFCDVTFHCQRDLAAVIKLRALRWGINLGDLGGPSVLIGTLTR